MRVMVPDCFKSPAVDQRWRVALNDAPKGLREEKSRWIDQADRRVQRSVGVGILGSPGVNDGIIPRSPCSRKTAPKSGSSVPTWPPRIKSGASTTLSRRARALRSCWARSRASGCRRPRRQGVSDVDFMRGIAGASDPVPGPAVELETSMTPVPIASELALMLSAEVARTGADVLVTSEIQRAATPWTIERAMREVRGTVKGLPEGFRLHDPAALLCLAAHLGRAGRQGRPGAAAARLADDDPQHVWARVAQRRRVRPRCR